ACACGAFLLPDDGAVSVTSEAAIISFDGQEQRTILTMDVDSSTHDAALLIPTPAPATVEISRREAFQELAEFTAPVPERVDVWWPDWIMGDRLSPEGIEPGPPLSEPAEL